MVPLDFLVAPPRHPFGEEQLPSGAEQSPSGGYHPAPDEEQPMSREEQLLSIKVWLPPGEEQLLAGVLSAQQIPPITQASLLPSGTS